MANTETSSVMKGRDSEGEQSLANHTRLHPIQHFIWLPLSAITLVTGLVYTIVSFIKGNPVLLPLLVLAASIVGFISGFLARRNALVVQDRIIRMEEQFRYFRITGEMPSEEITVKQWIALRFASDQELAKLAQQAGKEQLTGKQIKERIKHWRSDLHRV